MPDYAMKNWAYALAANALALEAYGLLRLLYP